MKTFTLRFILSVALLCTLLTGTSWAQQPFTLKGKIGQYNAPAKLFLQYTEDGKQITEAIPLTDGKFEFKGTLKNATPANLYLVTSGNEADIKNAESFDLIINPASITLKGSALENVSVQYTHRPKIVTAQSSSSVTGETVDTKASSQSKSVTLEVGTKDDKDDSDKFPRAFGGITFTRLDWGLSRLLDDGKFSLSDDNQFMKYKKASNFGFDLAQFGLRVSDNFKTYISAGFEWNYLRLKQNILLKQDVSPIAYEQIDPNEVEYTKNILTSTYLRLPLTFEWRSDKNSKGERVKVAFGAMTGVLLKGTQRLKSKEQGKQKFKDNYSLASFQYGPFLRIGYDDLGIFAKYYVNDFFENSPAQKGLSNLAFGLTLGF
ncbi:DUF4369 domain-containing protein [Sphingobacterium thermophilum]|uniref:Outer membrane protein beta-barrel domain-containing protein n=1 Tax=Sphingobacterium thermophilum TaxID=768534 RepID=A0ABP8R0P4_9SPHI